MWVLAEGFIPSTVVPVSGYTQPQKIYALVLAGLVDDGQCVLQGQGRWLLSMSRYLFAHTCTQGCSRWSG